MDTWANEILARIEYAQDLVATEAIYHQSCIVSFRQGRDIGDLSTQNIKRGRKLTYDREAAFLEVVVFLEKSESDQVTLQDLVQLMSEHLDENSEPFTSKHMKSRLIENFGERLFVTDEKGKKCIVTLQRTASLLIHSLYKESKDSNPETQKQNIIETAAKLIKNDIKDMKQCNEIYPDVTDIESFEKCMAFIPTSLRIFLDKLISSKQCTLRIASVAQAIIQATMPKTIMAPLQLTLGVQLHLLFGSQMLIEMLNELGFCCSYSEVQKFEKSAAVSQTFDEPDLSGNEFIQFMADNVDYNVRTLDGRNTFHGMGMIATVTPGISHKRTVKIDQDSIKIDPQLLFQRLITAAQGLVPVEDLKDVFGHELCTFPPPLFESDHLMRTANKATLANEMIRCAKLNNEDLERRIHFDNQTENFKYVIDGGSLLHKLSWPRGNTYNQICGMYVKYLVEIYNKPIVVFDGYDGGPSTKDNVHIRRTGGRMGAEVLVRGDLLMNTKTQQFLLNKQNKQKCIYLMDDHLHASGIETLNAPADADFLIVKTAVKMASEYNTIIIGEDTDLLVLLCYHADSVNDQLFLQGRNGKFVNIQAVQDSLGKEICSNLLFIHAVLGCDTVSKPSGLGKHPAHLFQSIQSHYRLLKTHAHTTVCEYTTIC